MTPSTVQFSRPSPCLISSGSILTMMMAPLAFCDLELDALDLGVAVLLGREQCLGGGVDEVADLEVGGLDRGADDVADEAHALLPDRVLESEPVLGVGHLGVGRAEVAQAHDEIADQAEHGSEQGVADQRAAADAGLLEPEVERLEGRLAVLVAGGGGVPQLEISWSPISLRAHWMMPMPMKSIAPPRLRPRATVEAPRPMKVSKLSPISRAK